MLFATVLLTWPGCAWFHPPEQPYVAENAPIDIAIGINVVATPFHRVIVHHGDQPDSTRIVIFYVRVESVADDAFWVAPGEMTLIQGDGTVGTALDRDRAQALLEREDLWIADADPAMRDPAGMDRTAEAQSSARRAIQSELLADTEIQRDGVARGYVVIDMRRAQSSFDGSTLHVGLRRIADGATMRQMYHFESAPVATADTPANTAQ